METILELISTMELEEAKTLLSDKTETTKTNLFLLLRKAKSQCAWYLVELNKRKAEYAAQICEANNKKMEAIWSEKRSTLKMA